MIGSLPEAYHVPILPASGRPRGRLFREYVPLEVR